MPSIASPQVDELETGSERFGPSLQTSEDAARFLGVRHGALIHCLYKAEDATRYRNFEIPKRSGGMRRISAPRGMLRDLQDQLLPALQEIYDAHPAAHGFIKDRNVVSNAQPHAGQRLVFNIDLADFFPTINFGRIRGLFMKPPFGLGAPAATVFAQICTYRNGLPQGAPTSPVLSNLIASSLDRCLLRLARENKLNYSRYADDITFSTSRPVFPASVAVLEHEGPGSLMTVKAGEALEDAIRSCGFAINAKKVRLQGRGVQQSVTGLCVNEKPNVERSRIRKIRAMIHAWEKFGIEAAGKEYFARYGAKPKKQAPESQAKAFRNVVYGQLAFVKMVRGPADPVFLKLCRKLIDLDPNPSKFIREMAFGGADFDVFISHASEDKAEIARPIYQACQLLGIKTFLDEEHIAWGQSFAQKINTAMGAARTILAVVTPHSVSKEWPIAEVNSALALEISGDKNVVVLMAGKPDLSMLPLLRTKKYLVWNNDPANVAKQLQRLVKGNKPREQPEPKVPVPVVAKAAPATARSKPVREPTPAPQTAPPRSWFNRLFGRKK